MLFLETSLIYMVIFLFFKYIFFFLKDFNNLHTNHVDDFFILADVPCSYITHDLWNKLKWIPKCLHYLVEEMHFLSSAPIYCWFLKLNLLKIIFYKIDLLKGLFQYIIRVNNLFEWVWFMKRNNWYVRVTA